jgi:hypothetical protein
MGLPEYLKSLALSTLPVDYEWEWENLIPFRECGDEDSPRLAEALQLLNARAWFAISIAGCEWIVARVEGHIDTSETRKRIQAAWAVAIDHRYASFPEPPDPSPSLPQEFVRPLHMAEIILSDACEGLADDEDDIFSAAQGSIMLASHVAGRHQAFDPWLAESLSRCHEHYPVTEDPTDQMRVPSEIFVPDFEWTEKSVGEAIQRFVQTLDPTANPCLRSAQDMLADGFEGQPYSGSD